PEISSEKIWESIIKKLFQKDYKFDATFFGSLNEYARKVAYFFHASLQGTACYPGAATTLQQLKARGVYQGMIADAQCFTSVQLQRGLRQQEASAVVDDLFDADLRSLSYEQRSHKPSERLYRLLLQTLENKGISPEQALHIGSRVTQDVVPARKLGMR